ncbi:tripartite tricarboxylate transporter permease [Yangia mangrovi]|uniref:Tripartite tricarboxylate transporter permease n=1 Tax=Alloyangia mangrovi TaxID=1779329 RepID=A0ABT2KR94_9RHOB|nr:tripartite tricarboxylate transporter permease [Alloyangia mangrovi]MCT4373344.1 tripartite tricarboxylate transporter permease [Alloyangia mangrovi]
MLSDLMGGFGVVLQPMNLLILASAVLIGFVGGALPGISGVILVVILLPVTYSMEPTGAFMLLTAIYASSVFSGLITAILYRAPGTPEAVMTAIDGYPMTQKGEAGKALGIGILSSAVGGMFGTIVLIVATPLLAGIALQFSSPEFFALAVLGLTVVASLGGNLIMGVIGVCIGLIIASVGLDPLTGTARFTFGNLELMSGINLIPVIIGLFAISEVLKRSQEGDIHLSTKSFRIRIFDWPVIRQIRGAILRSSILGTAIGILPGIGASTAAMVAYSETVRWSKDRSRFGRGAPEGVAPPRGRQQRRSHGRARAALRPRHPGVWHHGGDPRRLHRARADPGADLHERQHRPDLRGLRRPADRQRADPRLLQAVHRGSVEAARRALFGAWSDHRDLLRRRHLFGAELDDGCLAHAWLRSRRLPAREDRLPAGRDHPRRGARSDRRERAAPLAGHVAG